MIPATTKSGGGAGFMSSWNEDQLMSSGPGISPSLCSALASWLHPDHWEQNECSCSSLTSYLPKASDNISVALCVYSWAYW